MAQNASSPRPPLALIASGHEWSARSFESVLSPNGFAVLRAYTGQQALQQARAAQPDAIFVDASLSDMQGADVCRALRDDSQVTAQTPIFITTAGPASRQERLDALRAGACDLIGLPLDAEALLLKLNTLVQAKVDADRARDESLLDFLTGCYNMRGLIHRVRELGSAAFRHRRPLACIVLSPESGADGEHRTQPEATSLAVDRLADVFRQSCRISDTLGRLGEHEFAVLAPDTDETGALQLAQRLVDAVEAELCRKGDPSVRVRVGFFAVPDFHEASIQPVDMLVRATTALRRSQAQAATNRIQPFEN